MDSIWEWARQLRELWLKEIFSLEGNRKMTFAMREGSKVETTAETLGQRQAQLAELNELIEKHEARNHKG